MKFFKLALPILVIFTLFLSACNSVGSPTKELLPKAIITVNPTTISPQSTPYYDISRVFTDKTPKPFSKATYVTSSAINLVNAYLKTAKEEKLFDAFCTGKILDQKTINKLTCKKDVIKLIHNLSDDSGQYSEFKLVDIDNDSKDEIFISMTFGMGAFSHFAVLEKDTKGVYYFSEFPNLNSNVASAVRSAVVNLGGYNCYIESEYGVTGRTGVQIFAFNKGKYIENLKFQKYVDKYKSFAIGDKNKNQFSLIKKVILSTSKALNQAEKNMEYYGELERSVTPFEISNLKKDYDAAPALWKKADINNDKIDEIIFRKIEYGAQSIPRRMFDFEVFNDNILIDLGKVYNQKSPFNNFSLDGFWTDDLQYWVEKYNGVNYLCILKSNNNKQNIFYTDVYLLNKNNISKVTSIETNKVISPHYGVWTEGVNIKIQHDIKYTGEG